MPIIKSAIKKERSDKRRTAVNRAISSKFRNAEKKALKSPSAETLQELYSTVDVAVKKHVLKKNTAARIKAGVVRAVRAKMDKSPFSK